MPCPGCGLPWTPRPGEDPWVSKGTMYHTPEEAEWYEQEEIAYRERHPDCRAARYGSSYGGIASHCARCCPLPPIRADVARLLRTPTPPTQIMRWRVQRVCGHVTEERRNIDRETFEDWFGDCKECGEKRIVVASEPVGLVEEPKRPAPEPPSRDDAARAKLARLEAEVERLRSQLGES